MPTHREPQPQPTSVAADTTDLNAPEGTRFVERMVLLAILLIGSLAITSSTIAADTLERSNQERELAEEALQATMEAARAISIASRDKPAGWGMAVTAAFDAGGSIGNTFDIPGLDRWASESAVGTVEILRNETLTDAEIGLELGMPRDLDGNGVADNPHVGEHARLLPIVVTLRWDGAAGKRQLVRSLYLSSE